MSNLTLRKRKRYRIHVRPTIANIGLFILLAACFIAAHYAWQEAAESVLVSLADEIAGVLG